MYTRRKFLAHSALGSIAAVAGATTGTSCANTPAPVPNPILKIAPPLVLSTWDFGKKANAAAWNVLSKGGNSLDAVEQGVMVIEADPENQSVGIGGLPDRDGRVTLDACIMDSKGNAGSVSALEHIVHPVSVARMVMEKTPHVMLVAEGALQFALAQGFKKENLLTEKSRQDWEEWKIESKYDPEINVEKHDTIGMIAIDSAGEIAGCCTTSGLGFKMHGRVGDSPIIGAGMYVDDEVGGAAATGLGEVVLKMLGSFLIVELMRQGATPQQACEEAVSRIVKKQAGYQDIQVGFIAMNKAGEIGAFSIQPGFEFALRSGEEDKVFKANSFLKEAK